jgi:formate dehydrogenase assembly factor FdhD
LSISVNVTIRLSGETRFAILRRPPSITDLAAGLLVSAR